MKFDIKKLTNKRNIMPKTCAVQKSKASDFWEKNRETLPGEMNRETLPAATKHDVTDSPTQQN